MWGRPLAVLEMRTSPSVLSRGVPWSSDTCSCCIGGCGNQSHEQSVPSFVRYGCLFPLSTTCKTLEREVVRRFADLDFDHCDEVGVDRAAAPPAGMIRR